jgi:hypothetical protein
MLKNKTGSPVGRPARRLNRRLFGVPQYRLLTLGVLGGVFAFFSIFANNFFTVRSVLNLLVQTSTCLPMYLNGFIVLGAVYMDQIRNRK